MIRIVVLNDDRCFHDYLQHEHGLSLYIHIDNKAFLLDVGQTDIFMKNALKLNIDLNQIDAIVLSHGHYDHARGLKHYHHYTKLITHPACTIKRISKRTGHDDSIDMSYQELNQSFNLILTKQPYKIAKNIFFLGEIPRVLDYEAHDFPTMNIDGTDDQALDDSGVVIKTSKGIIVISGCAHSGICNTIKYAKKVTDDKRVLAVMGGFHLKQVDVNAYKTIQHMKDQDIENIYLGHCTSDIVCEEFKRQLGNHVHILSVGYEFLF